MTIQHHIITGEIFHGRVIHELQERCKHKCTSKCMRVEFIHSIGTWKMCIFLAVLRSFFHFSMLYTLSFHPIPPSSLPSSLTSSYHLFLGLPLSLLVSKFITLFWESYFLPFSLHAQTNVFNLIVLLQWGF